MTSLDHDFLIAGGGIAGMTLALSLRQIGKSVLLVEKRERNCFLEEELRSINFTLTARGLVALERLGLRDRVLTKAVRLCQRAVHDGQGGRSIRPYGSRESHAIYSIRRAVLLQILQDEIDRVSDLPVLYGATISAVHFDTGTLSYKRSGETHHLKASTIVGADGAFSRVRSEFVQQGLADCELQEFPRRYMELQGSKEFVSSLGLQPETLHVWTGGDALLVGIPNPDGTLAMMFLSQELEEANRHIFGEIFAAHFPQIPMLAELCSQLKTMPLGRLVTCRLSRWSHRDQVVFLGDACHAVLPFYGQGMNAALEDCFVLCEFIERGLPLAQAFAAYELRRRPDAEALDLLSHSHFHNLQRSSIRWQAATLMDLSLSRITRGRWFYEYEKVAHTSLSYELI